MDLLTDLSLNVTDRCSVLAALRVGKSRGLTRLLLSLSVVCGLALPALLSGCGVIAGNGMLGGGTAQPVVSMQGAPLSINAGSSSTLTVTATNATQVTVTGSDGSSYTLSATGGTQQVSPTATTTYTATGTGPGGNGSSKPVTINVNSTPASPTVKITANPTSITAGGSSTLTVTATNATQVVVTGSDSSSYTLSPSGGTQVVSPSTTTTYTVTATGASGTTPATDTATLTVTAASGGGTGNPAPTVQMSAMPNSIAAGGSSVLSVVATNATAVTVTGSDGSSYHLTATGGTQAVSPATTTTYIATATGPGGTASSTPQTITVTPNPPPTVQITPNPASITEGSSSTLTVTTAHATQVVITGSDGSSYTLQSSNGTQSVSPTTTTTYTATATGPGGTASASTTVTVTPAPAPTVTINPNPATIVSGNSSVLTVTATNATQVTVTGTDGSSYSLSPSGGTETVTPTTTTTYTATATGTGNVAPATQSTTVTVDAPGSILSIDHVIFMLQENHTFDNYFGMLNPYRQKNNFNIGDDGTDYEVDGIDDKLNTISNQTDECANGANAAGCETFKLFKFTSSCIDDETSSWLESYGQVSRYDFSPNRPIVMDGFVHTAEDYAKNCGPNGNANCAGTFSDFSGQRAMGYYDENTLNYYYYMASQFALSDRWFSPLSSKSIPNRIATFTAGTTQGLAFDPGNDDHLPQLDINNIFEELDQANVSWKIYYTVDQGGCLGEDDCNTNSGASSKYPATDFSYLSYSYKYLYQPPNGQPATAATCTPPTQPSSVVGDTTNSFCIDPTHIAPLSDPNYGYFADLANGLPSFAFIEAGYGQNDEHPGSGQSILYGQQEVAKVVNALMTSSQWNDSVFFFAYDEGGGPYDHVPPVPGHSNDYTDANVASSYPDIQSIAVNADNYNPCLPPTPGQPTLHCDLNANDPGAQPTDAAAIQGFAAQLGFRLPNMVISPFSRRHYVSHIPMDHTAIMKFVENRFIGSSAHLTARDAAQPNLLNFFDFNTVPWATPPTPPTPLSPPGNCSPTNFAQ